MYKLEFKTTNNTVEYEALILGLREAKYLGIQELAVFGDFELVIQQVNNVYQVKQHLLKVYINDAWDLIENFFIAFNITFFPREYNETTNSLALAVAYCKVPKVTHLKYPIDVRYRPSVPNDMKHWKVFQDDQEIKEFLELIGEFAIDLVDQVQELELNENEPCTKDSIADHKIVELKGNFIPKGLVPLERLFSKDHTLLKPTLHTTEESVVSCNIGSEVEPKMIRMSKLLSEGEKKK